MECCSGAVVVVHVFYIYGYVYVDVVNGVEFLQPAVGKTIYYTQRSTLW